MGNASCRFQDIIDVPRLQSLMESFHKAFSTLVAILDTDENVLVAAGWQDICTKYHRVNAATCARCKMSGGYIRRHLQPGKFVEYKCQNGLWDIATPIIINGEHLATFLTGQFFYDDETVDTAFFREQARSFGFSEEEYLAALKRVPVYSRQKVRDMMEYYLKYVQTLADMGLARIEREKYQATLEQQVQKRTAELETATQNAVIERNKLTGILEAMEDGVYIVSRQYDIEYVNPVIRREFGPTGGKKCFQYFHGREEACPWCKNPEVFAGKSVHWEWYSPKNRRHYDLFDTPIQNADGSLSKFEIFHDVTERKKALEALRQSRELYRAIFEQVADYMLVLRPQNDAPPVIIDASQSAFDKHGYTREEMLGRPLTFLAPDDAQIRARLDGIMRRGEGRFEALHKKKDGATFLAEVFAKKLEVGDETLLHTVERDITERKKAEDALRDSETRFRQFSEAVFDGVVIHSQGAIITGNKQYADIFGYDLSELPGLPVLNTVAPEFHDEVKKRMAGGYDRPFEAVAVKKDGSRIIVRAFGRQITYNGKPARVSVIADITEQKRAERALVEAKEHAEEATRLKDKFVSLVSHDLKAPLSSMLLALKLLRDDLAGPGNEGASLIINRAIESNRQMTSLINDLLNVSRIRTGQVRLDRRFFDAKLLGAKMSADYSYLAEQKGIALKNLVPDNSRIYGDRLLLAQAIQNLVTNAIKFCRKGDHISISRDEDDPTSISVSDTGPGIKPEVLEKIFREGEKISTEGTAGEVGSGLGLQLTREIMELHGGRLDADCELGKGCHFTLRLPYVRPRILIVDDDETFRLLMEMNLRKMGANFSQAQNGQQALEAAAKEAPHLIISDIKMPVLDGLGLLRRLKERPETKDIPVIMVSGEFGMEIRDTIFKLGAEDFITKNDLDPVNLFPRVRRFIA